MFAARARQLFLERCDARKTLTRLVLAVIFVVLPAFDLTRALLALVDVALAHLLALGPLDLFQFFELLLIRLIDRLHRWRLAVLELAGKTLAAALVVLLKRAQLFLPDHRRLLDAREKAGAELAIEA